MGRKGKKLKAHFSSDYDVVICGAGISGLYSAWRLLTSNSYVDKNGKKKKPRIAILELSNRIGGRIESIQLDSNMRHASELGAMRYLEHHKIVSELIRTFKIPVERFSPSDRKSYYLRGKNLVDEDFKSSEKVPYFLHPDETNKTPDELLEYALNKILPGYSQLKPEDWGRVKNSALFNGKGIKNIPLYKLGFSNALQDVLSHEAFSLLKDTGGYDSNYANWNTAEALIYLKENFEKNVKAFYVPEGMSKLPGALAQEIVRLGGDILMTTKLLSFEKEKEQIICKISQSHSQPMEISADNLILALPKRALELIDQSNSFFRSDEVQELLSSVQVQPAIKLFLTYKEAWWENSDQGESVIMSDLPVRMSYYYTSKNKSKAMVMVYEDMDPDYYWQELYTKNPKHLKEFGGQQAPQKMIEAVQAKLGEIHKIDIIPQPLQAFFKDWTIDPYGGGYHVWRPAFNTSEVMNKIRKPMSDCSVYICGEAYSSAQSWMEGALRTAESLLRDYFSVEALQGLPVGYKLIDDPDNSVRKKAANE